MIINKCVVFHSSGKLIVHDSDIYKAFISIIKASNENKNFSSKDWIVKTIVEISIEIFLMLV